MSALSSTPTLLDFAGGAGPALHAKDKQNYMGDSLLAIVVYPEIPELPRRKVVNMTHHTATEIVEVLTTRGRKASKSDTRATPDLARNAAINAMRIMECLPPGTLEPGAFPSATFDRVAECAVAMAEIENAPGFAGWDMNTVIDWETACENVATNIHSPVSNLNLVSASMRRLKLSTT